jgi:hypothetical protein
MIRELICAWLGLSVKTWPPDHYTLLGLPPGESDPALIEQRVHERLERLRCYQLAHPELVTEAMNRLAQAFVCLTDPAAKQEYDQQLLSPASEPLALRPPSSPESNAPARNPTSAVPDPLAWLFGPWNFSSAPALPEPQDVFDWETAPPPPRLHLDSNMAKVPNEPLPDGNGTGAADTGVAAPASATAVKAAAGLPSPARRGLGTKRALYYRVSRTRQLLWTWEQAGKYLHRPTQLLTKPAEATELIQLLQTIRELLRSFPPLLGQAGQPGYLVVALARQQLIVPTFQTLLPSQRQALARDWQAGYRLLLDHRQFLREELRGLRRRSRLGRAVRLLRSACTDHPGLWLFLLALVALNVAEIAVAHRPLHFWWPQQIVILLVLAGFRLLLWWDALQPIKLTRPPAPPARRARQRPKAQRQAR